MSEQPSERTAIPEWDLADRMRKSLRPIPGLRESAISTAEMAAYLDVDRSSVSNWLSGRIFPSAQTARLWALRTGVPFSWLCHGNTKPCDVGPVIAGTSRRASTSMHKLPTRVVA